MGNRIALAYKLEELEQHHQKLDKMIKRGYTNYLDDNLLSKIKQEKLQIKQKITSIKEQITKF